jgi:DNA-binding NarL/FixJ family response regulator
MSYLKKYQPLVIEPDTLKQAYLYQAIRAEPDFGKPNSFRNLESALKYLRSSPPVDVVLISFEFTQYVINQFMLAAKESRGGKEAAYVLLASTNENSREHVALSMMEGMDGVLFSPFSVESVKEVVRVAEKVRKKFEMERKKAALLVLLPNVVSSLDDLAKVIYENGNTLPAKKRFMSTLDSINLLRKDLPDDYYYQLFKLCEESSPRSLSSRGRYVGASKRLRSKHKSSN